MPGRFQPTVGLAGVPATSLPLYGERAGFCRVNNVDVCCEVG